METSSSDDRGQRVLWLPGEFAICRLAVDAPTPDWPVAPGQFFSATRTADELSVICDASIVPGGVECTRGWRLGRLEGTFPHDCAGVLASVIAPLARNGISVFACATFDTDYLLVSAEQLAGASQALLAAGHAVRGVP